MNGDFRGRYGKKLCLITKQEERKMRKMSKNFSVVVLLAAMLSIGIFVWGTHSVAAEVEGQRSKRGCRCCGTKDMGDSEPMKGKPGDMSKTAAEESDGSGQKTKTVSGLTVGLSTADFPKEGDVSLRVKLTNPEGRAVTNAQVAVSMSMPSMNMKGPAATLKHTGGVFMLALLIS